MIPQRTKRQALYGLQGILYPAEYRRLPASDGTAALADSFR